MIWMRIPRMPQGSQLGVFRNVFSCAEDGILQLDFSADKHCRLFLDGRFITDGPENCTRKHWKKKHLAIPVSAGDHQLIAEVVMTDRVLALVRYEHVAFGLWCVGNLLKKEDWRCLIVPRCYFRPGTPQYLCQARYVCDLEIYDRVLQGAGDGWEEPLFEEDPRELFDAELPELLQTEETDFFRRGNVFVFRNYVCVWTEIVFEGRGMAEVRWLEEGCDEIDFETEHQSRFASKLNEVRPDILDIFPADGGVTRFRPFTWDAGRLMEVRIKGSLQIREVHFLGTGYPVPPLPAGRFDDDTWLLLKKSRATLQACLHDTFYDCPYYERCQYVSDGRIQSLSLQAIGGDLRLTEKALQDFADGICQDGALGCRSPRRSELLNYPERRDICFEIIPAFEALFPHFVHDYALTRRNDEFVKSLLPVIRKQIERFRSFVGDDGTIRMPGWNFIDWLDEYNWSMGCPPGTELEGGGATLNWLIIGALDFAADLEKGFGDASRSAEDLTFAAGLRMAVDRVFFDEKKQCYAETSDHAYFSEHANVIAMLTEPHPEIAGVLDSGKLIPAGISFSFYTLEACANYGLTGFFARRKARYIELAKLDSLKTMPEVFLSSHWLRSQCHAWSAHFLWHCYRRQTFARKLFL